MDGHELREARERAGLTLQSLASRAHMALSTIQKYEREGVPPGAREAAIRRALAEAADSPDMIPTGTPRPVPRTALQIPLPEALHGLPDDIVQIWQFRVLSEAYAIAVTLAEQEQARKQQ